MSLFQDIPQSIKDQMAYLEAIDEHDRRDGTPQASRLRQILPETGRFLALIAAGTPQGDWLEIGTSGGYSGLWLSLAGRVKKQKLTTFEISSEKVRLAQETFQFAGVTDWVRCVHDDALRRLADFGKVSFCFMDSEKGLYQPVFELVVPNLVSGGLFLADNAISHQEELHEFLDFVAHDRRVDSLVVPIGKGVLLCRKV